MIRLNPVQSSSTLQDNVYQELFQAIVSGRIRPGERLVLETLAKQLGVSIMPVREAIRKLEAGSMVSIINRRIVVNELSAKTVKDILEVRIELEGFAAAKAAQVRKDEILDQLQDMLDQMRGTDNIEDYLRINRQFHNTIYREVDNPILQDAIDALWERYSPYLHLLLNYKLDWNKPGVANNHVEMFNALRRQDAIEIRKWVEKDLDDAATMVLEMLALRNDETENGS